jgi:4-phytase/acid phosphatase
LDTLFFDLYSCTPYLAQIQASDLADHILATLEQAVLGRAVTGAIGSPGDRMAILVGHDDNIIPLGKLLNIGWRVPGSAANLALPGGALVFELRRARGDGRFLVRTRYVSETLEQMRDAAPLTLEHPPATEPIFVPGCSLASPGYDAPLDLFAAHLRAAIDPVFTSPEPPEVR